MALISAITIRTLPWYPRADRYAVAAPAGAAVVVIGHVLRLFVGPSRRWWRDSLLWAALHGGPVRLEASRCVRRLERNKDAGPH